MFSNKKFKKSNFSLIELLIVIGIMGALAALILPAFSDSESASKDTVCDYNQAGTLRYLNMFYGANGVYPTGFHTGAQVVAPTAGDSDLVQLDDASGSALTTAAAYNFGKASDVLAIDSTASDSYYDSLVNAGIVSLAYGKEIAKNLNSESFSVYTVNDSSSTKWTEDIDPVSGDIDPNGSSLMVKGIELDKIASVGNASATVADDAAYSKYYVEGGFKIVPLFVAPTIDWEKYYSGGPNDSKVSIAMAGKCPWGEGGQARYYIAFFMVYGSGDPAKLLATSCPDCGILESDTF